MSMEEITTEARGTNKAFVGARAIIAVIIAGIAMLCIPTGCVTVTELITGATNITQNATTNPQTPKDAIDYNSLKWAIGRTKPTVESPAIVAEIKAGKSTGSTLYFSWVDAKSAGVALGSSTHDPAELRAYVFYSTSGGFFDWVTVTRTSRGLENSNGTEWGWPSVDHSQRPLYFFIGSKDGKTRTNIIQF